MVNVTSDCYQIFQRVYGSGLEPLKIDAYKAFKMHLHIHIYIYIYIYIYIHIYVYITVHHVPKCMSCDKAIVVITGKAYCFPD